MKNIQIITHNTGKIQVLENYNHRKMIQDVVVEFRVTPDKDTPSKQQIVDGIYRAGSKRAILKIINSISGAVIL